MFAHRVALLSLIALAGCPSSDAAQCEGETFCPAGTRCSTGGRCLAESCASFADSTPCFLESGPGFCSAGACAAAIDVSGRLTDFPRATPEVVADARIEALDRPWMDVVTTDSQGVFHLPAIAGDRAVEIEVRATGFVAARTRKLDLGTDDYVLDGDAKASMLLIHDDEATAMMSLVGLTHDRSLGYVGLIVGETSTGNLLSLGGATVTMTGSGQFEGPFYFNAAGITTNRVTTSGMNAKVVFGEVEPGDYTITVARDGSGGCVGAGTDAPAQVELTVLPDTLTWVGWVVCAPE